MLIIRIDLQGTTLTHLYCILALGGDRYGKNSNC